VNVVVMNVGGGVGAHRNTQMCGGEEWNNVITINIIIVPLLLHIIDVVVGTTTNGMGPSVQGPGLAHTHTIWGSLECPA